MTVSMTWRNENMYGTVTYFTNQFIGTMMNNLAVDRSISLNEHFKHLQSEINNRTATQEEKEHYLANLLEAYSTTYEALVGKEGTPNEN